MFRYAIFDSAKEPRELLRVIITYKVSELQENLSPGQIALVYGKLTSLERRAVDQWLKETEKIDTTDDIYLRLFGVDRTKPPEPKKQDSMPKFDNQELEAIYKKLFD